MDTSTGPWLFGYALSGYKSLRGDQMVRVAPLGKINFLVGRNNHGKSAVLHTAGLWTTTAISKQIDRRVIDREGVVKTETLIPVHRPSMEKALRQWQTTADGDELRAAGRLVDIDESRVGIWLPSFQSGPARDVVTTAVRHLVGSSNFTPERLEVPEAPFSAVLIPAFRALLPRADRGTSNLASGEGLVSELGAWQSPAEPNTDGYRRARDKWRRLKEFMRDVLEDPHADLEIANNQTDLHVRLAQAGEMLQIDDLGDGIKQVLMIAAASLHHEGSLILLEEPEIHLHAGLQRKLMRFLNDKIESQFIIATHSAHVLDLEGAHIFHVTHDGTCTRVAPAIRASEVRQVCQDLGYMASDLLQANYTIWVEGPSDRVYWKRWLEVMAPDLVEGVHFAVMTYGGYLIDGVHLLDEPDETVDDLVHLLQLGRECTVIADSDKDSVDAELRSTLRRLTEETNRPGSGHLITCEWVRTVENLVPRDLFVTAVQECHRRAGKALKGSDGHSPFDDPFAGMAASTYSKVKIAQHVAPRITSEAIGPELAAEVEALAALIRRANGFEPAGQAVDAQRCEHCGAPESSVGGHQAPSDSAS